MQSFYSISCQNNSAQTVISSCLQQLASAPKKYNFGFIYATDALSSDYPELIRQCKKVSGIEHWVGTLGIGIIASRKELYDLPAVSIMLANFDSNQYTMLPIIKTSEELAAMPWPEDYFTYFGLIHGDPFNPDTQKLIENIHNHLDDVFLVGGLTSSRNDQYQVAGEVYSGGISGVFFSEQITVQTNLTQGCSPVGKKHSITHARDNILATLDNKPALDVLMQDMHINSHDQLKEQSGEVFIGLCIPESDKSDYTVRNLVGVDFEQRLFAINDYLHEGNELIFCERNFQTANDDLQRMLNSLLGRLKGKPKGGIYISCLGRGRNQFGHNSEEIAIIHDTLGDFPLTGFFANGEIHHNKLYGYTGVLTLFT